MLHSMLKINLTSGYELNELKIDVLQGLVRSILKSIICTP